MSHWIVTRTVPLRSVRIVVAPGPKEAVEKSKAATLGWKAIERGGADEWTYVVRALPEGAEAK